MKNLHNTLNERLCEKKPINTKINALAEQTTGGKLGTFSGVFAISEISPEEKTDLEQLLLKYLLDNQEVSKDLQLLSTLTMEVRAISHQAVLLHGERIKKAQVLLKKYKEGAFSAWLVHTYGNRQTPYNFLQYYLFYSHVPKEFHNKIEDMPRQAIYTLASREGSLEKKLELVQQYQGESKHQLLDKIRMEFPLNSKDQRQSDPIEKGLSFLSKACYTLETSQTHIDEEQLIRLEDLVLSLNQLITQQKK